MKFLGIPKTGSRWVAKVALPLIGIKVPHSHRVEPERDGFTWTVVRHPRTWLPSCYRWMADQDWKPLPLTLTAMYLSKTLPSWKTWIEWIIERPSLLLRIVEPYVNCCEYVGRTETLAASTCSAFTMAGIKFNPGELMGREPYGVTDDEVKDRFPCTWTNEMERGIAESQGDYLQRFYSVPVVDDDRRA